MILLKNQDGLSAADQVRMFIDRFGEIAVIYNEYMPKDRVLLDVSNYPFGKIILLANRSWTEENFCCPDGLLTAIKLKDEVN